MTKRENVAMQVEELLNKNESLRKTIDDCLSKLQKGFYTPSEIIQALVCKPQEEIDLLDAFIFADFWRHVQNGKIGIHFIDLKLFKNQTLPYEFSSDLLAWNKKIPFQKGKAGLRDVFPLAVPLYVGDIETEVVYARLLEYGGVARRMGDTLVIFLTFEPIDILGD